MFSVKTADGYAPDHKDREIETPNLRNRHTGSYDSDREVH